MGLKLFWTLPHFLLESLIHPSFLTVTSLSFSLALLPPAWIASFPNEIYLATR